MILDQIRLIKGLTQSTFVTGSSNPNALFTQFIETSPNPASLTVFGLYE